MRRAHSNAAAFAAGALFAAGLAVGGMTRPSRVRGFLDFAGAWDPSLLFVMGGAVSVYFVLHRLVLRRSRPAFDTKFHLPTRNDLDARLLAGAAIFGVGWGLVGYCPGPAIASLFSGGASPVVFVVAMAVGMWIQRAVDRALARRRGRHAPVTLPPQPARRSS
jgi:uncharacterized membrane protein YedE/YeeE